MSNVAALKAKANVAQRVSAQPSVSVAAIEYAGSVEMSPTEWATILDNPRQRDTEAHARRADHLKTPHPAHLKVNMARLPDGRKYKLDGHTRSFMWQSGAVEAPPMLSVDVWNCRTLEDAKGLYSTFDSKKAVESAADQIFGAKREHGIKYESPLLANGKFSAGMRFAEGCLFGDSVARDLSIYDLLANWGDELSMLDDCKPTTKRFHTGIIAAALLTFRRYGADAQEFWAAFALGAGTKANGEVDAVQALEERMERRRAESRLTGSTNLTEIVGIAISAYERFRHGETYIAERVVGDTKVRGSGIKTTRGNSLQEWLIAAKKVSRRVI